MYGYYYLHKNKHIIFKPAIVANDPTYFRSPFIIKVWKVDVLDRIIGWKIILESLALGANVEDVKELCIKWEMTPQSSYEFMSRHRNPKEEWKEGLCVYAEKICKISLNEFWDNMKAFIANMN